MNTGEPLEHHRWEQSLTCVSSQTSWAVHGEGDDRPGYNGTSVQSQVEREKTVATNEGSPVRTTGRWDSYEVKGMTVDTLPEVMSLVVRGDRG